MAARPERARRADFTRQSVAQETLPFKEQKRGRMFLNSPASRGRWRRCIMEGLRCALRPKNTPRIV
jgi:hypothetical protein